MEKNEQNQTNPLTEMTAAEFITYCRRGEKLRHSLKPQIGELLLQERLKRKMPLEEVSHAIKYPAKKIELLELGKRKLNWNLVALLLKFYHKDLTLTLADKPTKSDNATLTQE